MANGVSSNSDSSKECWPMDAVGRTYSSRGGTFPFLCWKTADF